MRPQAGPLRETKIRLKAVRKMMKMETSITAPVAVRVRVSNFPIP